MQKLLWGKLKAWLLENRNNRQTVIKNTFWLSLSNIIARLVKAVLIIYAARILGAAGYGIFSYAVSLAAFFSIFSDLGVSALLTREASKRPEALKEYLSTSLVIKLCLLAVSIVLILLIAPIFTNITETIPLLPIAALLIAFDGLRDLSFSVTRAWEKMELEAGINIATNIAITVIGLMALIIHPTPRALLVGYTAGSGLGLVASLFFLRETFNGIFKFFKSSLVKQILREAWPFALMGLLGALTVNTDALIIGLLKGAKAVGLYSAAQRPVLLLYLLPAILSTSLFPSFARLAKDKERFREIFETAMTITFLISIPLLVGGILLSKEIMALLFGAEYIPATLTFGILMATVVTTFPNTFLTNGIFAHEAQRHFVKLFLGGALLNGLLDFILIPIFGIAGSAAGTVITQIIVTAFMWQMMKRINYFRITHRLPRILFASVIMGALTLALHSWGISLIPNIVISIATYAITLFLLKEPLFAIKKIPA